MEMRYLLEKTSYERPNGTFLGSFYWVQPHGLADYEEEWGRRWLDGVDYDIAISHPFYDKTGNTRPFGDTEELNRRRLSSANRKADGTWNLLGWKIEDLIFEEALNYSDYVLVDLKELAEVLKYLDRDL